MNIANKKRKKPVYGVGINDADYPVHSRVNGKKIPCPFYSRWMDMLVRCYSENLHERCPTYKDCEVAPEWHYFMTFRKWMMTQDWQGKQLDKDIMYPGNKTYGPETCLFVSARINVSMKDNQKGRGNYPQGVKPDHKKFQAMLRINRKYKHLGSYDTQDEAESAYREAKRLHLLTIACCEPDVKVKQGIYRHSLTYAEA